MRAEVARVRHVADPDRKGGGGLSLQTLAVASAASLTAAMVTSRLFPPGTIYASALTPVLVAAISEMLHRPAARVTELRRQRRTMVLEMHGVPTEQAEAEAEAEAEADAELGTTEVRERSRRVHPKVWAATGLAAFAIAAAVLTLPELIFGGAVATKHRTTFFGGGSAKSSTPSKTTTTTTSTETQTAPATVTETVPAQTPPQSTDTTQTDTTTTQTGTDTAPSGGAPAPGDTGTSTTPGGVAVPPSP
jgi:hypothetical protein